MQTLQGFPPIARHDAAVLILGSMPGEASLKAAQYYAHPRNSFWFIIENLFSTGTLDTYEDKKRALINNGIALWDVLHQCRRPGSLDSAIEPDSVVANDFFRFYQGHRSIHRVFFNGARAQAEYMKRVYPTIGNETETIQYQRLPSTSPAMASLSRGQKLEQWRIIRDIVTESSSSRHRMHTL